MFSFIQTSAQKALRDWIMDHVNWLLLGVNPEAADGDSAGMIKFVGMIVGSVVGGLLCLIIPITVIVFLCRFLLSF